MIAFFDTSINHDFDKDFKRLIDGKLLNFYPWVGKNYREGGFLILGKAHYGNENGSEIDDIKDSLYSRRILAENGIANKSPSDPFYSKILGQLFSSALTNPGDSGYRKDFFEQIAFSNLDQGIIRKGKTPGTNADSFRVFFEIAKILKPKICLFEGILMSFGNNSSSVKGLGIEVFDVSLSSSRNDVEVKTLSLPYGAVTAVFVKDANVRLDREVLEHLAL